MAKSRAARTPRQAGKKASRTEKRASTVTGDPVVVYIHGIGKQPDREDLKRRWDLALFGREMGDRTRMAYWSDILHGAAPRTQSARRTSARASARGIDPDALLATAGVDAEDEDAQDLARSLLRVMGVERPTGSRKKVLPLPAFLRKPISRAFLEAFIKDTAAYFFRPELRRRIRQRLLDVLPADGTPVTIVAHSQGTIISLEALAARAGRVRVAQFVTVGSPLGIREVQDHLDCPLEVPRNVEHWHNFADPLDPVALDKGLAGDFSPTAWIVDGLVLNTRTRRLEGFNPHSGVGYLAHPDVRRVVHAAIRFDSHARFVIARDVAEGLAADTRQSVLIEILEPGFAALDESRTEMRQHEEAVEEGRTALADRIERAAQQIEAIVGRRNLEAARVDRLRRFVAARLTPEELSRVSAEHKSLRVYAIWKSSAKRKLLYRSHRVIQSDAARVSYAATGAGIRWAVLDTGVRRDHPHFEKYGNIAEVWDCTKPGKPVALATDRDRDGHGTHVAGIIAGAGIDNGQEVHGIAPQAQLCIYKVLDDDGGGEDAWIIKALDHIAEKNENSTAIAIHGVNLSLGGPYDATVYGCGFSPICAELRRLWRTGVIVCVACGNEGQVEVSTPDGEVELNSPMSIGDPANLEDCVAVGSVNADRPHLYGVSSFSSHGPTADGRIKPDVVAPGERIRSCNSHYRSRASNDLYREESGTSMAAPHVSGLLAAFLSVRREFRGRPDEVKEILLRTCTDIARDRYHQGRGVPNLMKMLLDA